VKVALVGESFEKLGSLARAQVELARYLVGAGHEVHVYCDSRYCDRTLVAGVIFHDVPSAPYSVGRYRGAWRLFSFARSADRIIARDRAQYDVVFVRGSAATVCDIVHFPGVYLGERRRDRAARERTGPIRRAKDLVGPIVFPRGPLRVRLERRVIPRAHAIQVDSGQVRDDLVAHYGVDPGRIEVAPTGVNLEEFHPAADRMALRTELGFSTEVPLVLFCGHDFDRKGLDRVFQALARLREPVTLAVVGEGDIERYRELAARLGIDERVTFVGGRSDVDRFYRAADLFVFPTRIDMWGGPIIEAMASGVPPIASEAAGAAEAITDGVSGVVLPEPVDVDALAPAVDRLIASPELRERMGASAREAARAYSWVSAGERVEAAMNEVVSSRRNREQPVP
jgi:glycosyltransferase involved in cell wall biosynthesis